MVDSVYETIQKYGISFAKESTSEDKGELLKENKSDQKMEKCPWSEVRTLGCSLAMYV